jgi:fermentation-respiration switch protein FrsA (DUF1100 family)
MQSTCWWLIPTLIAIALAGCSDGAYQDQTQDPGSATGEATKIAAPTASDPQNHNVAKPAGFDGKGELVDELPETPQGESQQASAPTSSRKPVQSLHETLLFFPSKYPRGDWSPAGLEVEDCWFTAQDGTRLHGWYVEHPNPRALVLYAHGNAGNVAQWARVLRLLHKRFQVSVMIFDYRGYGRSEGVPTVKGALLDVRAARLHLAELTKVAPEEIVLWGRSLGGALAIDVAANDGARGLIVESTFSSLRDVALIHYPRAVVDWFIGDELNSVERIQDFQGPLLQSHGTADRLVPLSLARRLFEAANEPKQFTVVEGGDHNSAGGERYLQAVEAFLARLPDGAR